MQLSNKSTSIARVKWSIDLLCACTGYTEYMPDDKRIHATHSKFGHYEVIDTTYNNRPARVLYSGGGLVAQSGVALDDVPELLFDYNQRFLELVRGLRPNRVLLIGGGAFTLPNALLAEFPKLRLDVVEIDPVLFQIGQQYFDFTPSKHTTVHIIAGEKFLEDSEQQYDLIVLDAFFESAIPSVFQTNKNARQMAAHLRLGGVLAINIISSYYGHRSFTLRRQIEALGTAFTNVQLFPAGYEPSLWLPQNFIVTAQNGIRELQPYMRYAAVQLPDNTGDALYRNAAS